jgi:ABC-type polysaccharide/polyol phosphate transport system ATPase subunit
VNAIEVKSLKKLYRRVRPGYQLRTLKSALLDRNLVQSLKPEEVISALDDISFKVSQGEAFGVIGSNGSGKSTLLKVVAGILKPTSGEVVVDGRISALIELGAGFHPEISGRENIFINGAVLGLSRKEIQRRYDSIVAFSGLEEYIEEPVKNYSSGMYVRLGFAVAVHTDPDVLLVDEVLAVGDEAFAHRCLRRIEELLSQGKTLLFVSHSLGLVEDLCDRVLWLEKGRFKALGGARRVVDAYRQAVAEEEGRLHQKRKEDREAEPEAQGESPLEPEPVAEMDTDQSGREADGEPEQDGEELEDEPLRWGSGEAEIVGVRMLVGPHREERYHLRTGEEVTFRIRAQAHRKLEDFVFGIAVTTPRGVECWGTNTDLENLAPARFFGAAQVEVSCPGLRLGPGEYLLDVAIHARDGYAYDYRRKLMSFSVTSAAQGVGVYFPEHQWLSSGDIEWQS